MKTGPFLFCLSLWATATLTAHAAQFLDDGSSASTVPIKDDKAAFESCRRDAQKGDPKAEGLLGLMYEKGAGTEKNHAEALRWLEKGARKGDADAQNNLGFLYFQGQGVTQDYAVALKWFKKAAAQGLASAQANLGLMYGRGKGVPKDYAQAMEWFRKAALQDDVDSQVNLGMLYSLGQGTPKDYVESYYWFSLALDHEGLEDGKVEDLRNNIEWLEKHMTDEQMAAASRKLSDKTPTPNP